jgi:nitrate reductase delta subunit
MTHPLTALYQYPAPGYHESIQRAAQALPDLAEFEAAAAPLSVDELQEAWVRTFEMNPDTCLDIGWHLFGEQYERGEFLVKVRQELKRCGIPESTELPDHLSHVLELVARMAPEEQAKFTTMFLLPAIEKVLKGLAGRSNVFEPLVRATRAAVEAWALEPLPGGRGSGSCI